MRLMHKLKDSGVVRPREVRQSGFMVLCHWFVWDVDTLGKCTPPPPGLDAFLVGTHATSLCRGGRFFPSGFGDGLFALSISDLFVYLLRLFPHTAEVQYRQYKV